VIHSVTFWVLMFTAAGVIFILPIIIGLIRRIERLEVVVLLNLAALVTGLTWFGAIALAFILPRRLHLEQQATDLRLQLTERDQDLSAARNANRELMTQLNHATRR
jgi:hypothetical protein